MVKTSPDQSRTRRRLVLAGLLGAAVLTGGAGAAYAANIDDRAVETGCAVVVQDECPDPGGQDIGVSVSSEAGGY